MQTLRRFLRLIARPHILYLDNPARDICGQNAT